MKTECNRAFNGRPCFREELAVSVTFSGKSEFLGVTGALTSGGTSDANCTLDKPPARDVLEKGALRWRRLFYEGAVK